MSVFKLPELGEGLSEGEVVSWKVAEGDLIKADQTMVEIMTDKATVEVPSPASGRVTKLYYKPGQLAKVGGPLIEIADTTDGTQPAAKTSREVTAESHSTPSPSSRKIAEASEPTVIADSTPSKASSSNVLASPAVRKMAREMNLSLETIRGTGERGRVLREDLVHLDASKSARMLSPVASGRDLEERIPFIGVRRKIADRLSLSNHTAVHFTHFDEVDFSEIIRIREEHNAWAEKNQMGIRLTFLPYFIKGSIAALKRFPILNSSLDTDRNEVVIKYYYHFGISVQTDQGLMVAVIRDCDKKDIFQIAREIKETTERARTGKASLTDLTGSTITITNPGNIGGLYATPIINFPESVILGMFQIKKRPVVREMNGEDVIVSKPMMYTNITCDHRIVDGAVAAGYLRLFCDYMETPAKMAFS